MSLPDYEMLDWGITVIDSGLSRQGLAACYLLEHNRHYAFIDAGTARTVPMLLDLLAAKNIDLEKVSYVIPTHVHLDHAGGAGLLMQHLPNAKMIIHPRGARHMIDPQKLQAGALAVYGGQAFAQLFGNLVPVIASRVIIAEDGYQLDFYGRQLQFVDTPGHARHHFCVWDPVSSGFFTGDAFGLSYKELDTDKGAFLMPTSSPVQFDPQQWLITIDKLLAFKPQRLFLTHYGKVEPVPAVAAMLREGLHDYMHLARANAQAQDRVSVLQACLLELTIAKLRQHACMLSDAEIADLLAMDIKLNAQGIDVWLNKSAV